MSGYWDMRGFMNNILNVSVENVNKIGLQYCKIRLDIHVVTSTLWVSLNGTPSWSTVDTPWVLWACKLLSGYLRHPSALYRARRENLYKFPNNTVIKVYRFSRCAV